MTDNKKQNVEMQKEYEELVKAVRQELPNIVLPSMGMLDEEARVDINGKEYIISDNDKEE